MFCLAAFIILAILGIFSVRYRRLAAAALKCVARKATFRKCDTTFREDMKARLLGKLVIKRPRIARFLEKRLEVLAFVFVILMAWSFIVAFRSGLNLYVYETCDPANSESCSLGTQGCTLETLEPRFLQSLLSGQMIAWVRDQADQFGQTLNRLPDRIKRWNPKEYISKSSSYYRPYDPGKSTALEIFDPGCDYCAQQFRNIKQAGLEDRYNLTYIVYPIPDRRSSGSYKFPHSYLIASYLQAIKDEPLKNGSVPADWQLLERIFTWKDPTNGKGFQAEIDDPANSDTKVGSLLQDWLKNIGCSDAEVRNIAKASGSHSVKDSIARECEIVEGQIKAVRIPILILGSHRYDGVINTKKFR
jgi:hypothetical protein